MYVYGDPLEIHVSFDPNSTLQGLLESELKRYDSPSYSKGWRFPLEKRFFSNLGT